MSFLKPKLAGLIAFAAVVFGAWPTGADTPSGTRQKGKVTLNLEAIVQPEIQSAQFITCTLSIASNDRNSMQASVQVQGTLDDRKVSCKPSIVFDWVSANPTPFLTISYSISLQNISPGGSSRNASVTLGVITLPAGDTRLSVSTEL